MGRNWIQPDPKNILIDDTHCVMSKQDFDKLAEYSITYPTAEYRGKMWKAFRGGIWFLVWYGSHPNPDLLSINPRIILLIDN